MLPEDRREMGVGNHVAAYGEASGDLAVLFQETLLFRQRADLAQAEKRRDVAESLRG